MAFKAILSVAGKTYRILNYHFSLEQDTDPTGRPSSDVRGGKIDLEVESVSDTTLVSWMMDPYKHNDGTITFYQRDSEQKMKEVSFTEGYVTKYAEHFTNTGENPMTEEFTISAKEIKVGNSQHKNNWPAH